MWLFTERLGNVRQTDRQTALNKTKLLTFTVLVFFFFALQFMTKVDVDSIYSAFCKAVLNTEIIDPVINKDY